MSSRAWQAKGSDPASLKGVEGGSVNPRSKGGWQFPEGIPSSQIINKNVQMLNWSFISRDEHHLYTPMVIKCFKFCISLKSRELLCHAGVNWTFQKEQIHENSASFICSWSKCDSAQSSRIYESTKKKFIKMLHIFYNLASWSSCLDFFFRIKSNPIRLMWCISVESRMQNDLTQGRLVKNYKTVGGKQTPQVQ